MNKRESSPHIWNSWAVSSVSLPRRRDAHSANRGPCCASFSAAWTSSRPIWIPQVRDARKTRSSACFLRPASILDEVEWSVGRLVCGYDGMVVRGGVAGLAAFQQARGMLVRITVGTSGACRRPRLKQYGEWLGRCVERGSS